MKDLIDNINHTKTIFVTATNTDIGKTYTTIQLIRYLAKQGKRVGVYKPIETGVNSYPVDGKILLDEVRKYNSDFKATIDEVVLYQFELAAAPYVAKGDTVIDKRAIYTTYKKLLSMCDVLIVEGAGGLLVPIDKGFFMVDLIRLFDAYTILVSSSRLGSINDTLLSINLLEQKEIYFDILINLYEDKDSFYEVTYPYYKDNLKIDILQKSIMGV